MKKKLLLTVVTMLFVIGCCSVAFAADTFDSVLKRWTKEKIYTGDDKLSTLTVDATYYSAEFIEAYVQSQAQKNLWTQQEADNYKYEFLKSLRLQEMIPVQIRFVNNAQTMYLGPFDIMIKLRIGNQLYKPVDYDKRFNFKFQGEKEGLVYFRRFDEKTGKDLLKGVKQIAIEMPYTINASVTNGVTTKFMWDISNDDPQKLYQGKASSRFETDRLLKRLDILKKNEADLQKQLKSIEDEKGTIEKRLDELAKQ